MKEWREAFCPLCGRTMGMKNIYIEPSKPWTKTGEENRWETTQEFTGEKPFGVIKSSEGRGTMKFERYYDIDEDTEGFFRFMKQRLLSVIKEWIEKGWLNKKDIEDIINV